MKRSILSLVVFAVLLTTSAFAIDSKDLDNEKVAIAFKQKFSHAKDISWTKSNDVIKATFKMNGQQMNAFYTSAGALIGIHRNILTTQLPVNLQAGIINNYSGYWVTEVFEYATEDVTNYYITLENADKKVILQSIEINYWTVLKTIRKQ